MVVPSGRFTFAVYTRIYTQFTPDNDCNEVRRVICRQERAGRGPGLKLVRIVLILSSPGKAQSASKIGYFQSVSNIH